jgi:hypothetical protein
MGGAVQDPFYAGEEGGGVELNGRIAVGSSGMTRALQTAALTALQAPRIPPALPLAAGNLENGSLAAGTVAVVMALRIARHLGGAPGVR